jgi:hypothetical protein
MMARTERWLWGFAAVAALVAVGGFAATPTVVERQGSPARRAEASPEVNAAFALGNAAVQVVTRDPFRLERRPADVPFGAAVVPPASQPGRPPRPLLQLSGVSGPPWQAVLEGLPGHEAGILAREGDVFTDLTVRLIRPDSVVVDGADTTWVLTVRRAW